MPTFNELLKRAVSVRLDKREGLSAYGNGSAA